MKGNFFCILGKKVTDNPNLNHIGQSRLNGKHIHQIIPDGLDRSKAISNQLGIPGDSFELNHIDMHILDKDKHMIKETIW